MPSESSFDIVSKIDRQEADNALNQAAKEISNRFDFRGVGASIQWSGEDGVDIRANSEERAAPFSTCSRRSSSSAGSP
jgi:uncharacterized protein YajQ (UPF0234 family)